MIIAARAIGADEGYVYVCQYPGSPADEKAVRDAQEMNILGITFLVRNIHFGFM